MSLKYLIQVLHLIFPMKGLVLLQMGYGDYSILVRTSVFIERIALYNRFVPIGNDYSVTYSPVKIVLFFPCPKFFCSPLPSLFSRLFLIYLSFLVTPSSWNDYQAAIARTQFICCVSQTLRMK